ncbi:MAG: hypothetical protein V3T30_05115, partial [Thermodesulfobacteriota bacterium]
MSTDKKNKSGRGRGGVSKAAKSASITDAPDVFRMFAEASGQGFGMATPDTNIFYMNPFLASLLEENKP